MSDYDAFLDEFGERLTGAAAPRRHTRVRLRRPAVVVGLAAAGAAAVVVGVVVPGGHGLDAVARADAALAPSGQIIHMRLTSTIVGGHLGKHVPRSRTTELWSASDPPRWRFVDGIPGHGREEFAFAEGAQRFYSVRTDRMHVTSGYTGKDLVAASRTPGLVPVDPQRDLRPMIARGELKDAGDVASGGRTVHRFIGVQRDHRAPVVRRVTYDVDPKTYAPVGGELDITMVSHDRRGAKHASTFRTVFHVDRYAKVPDDDAHANVLRIATTPRTKVTTETIAEIKARIRHQQIRDRHYFVGAPRVAIVPAAGGQRVMVAVRINTLLGAPPTAVRLTLGARRGTPYGSPQPARSIGAPGSHCFLASLAPSDLPIAVRGVRAGTILRVLVRVRGTFEILANAQVQRYRSDARALDPAHYARTLNCG